MQIKSYNYQSIVEWSNSKLHSDLLACAQINPDENNMYNLDILSLDLSDRSKNLNVIGNSFYNVPFRCIAWDTYGQKQNTYPNGVIFGGMQDGSYTLWNSSQMITNYSKNKNNEKNQQTIQTQSSFLYGQQSQDGSYPIMCAQWNSLKNNYLAFGSTDLLILDIGKDISNPQIKKPGNRNPHQGSYITSVSWNKEVPNILASASQNGLIALWDIKANKSIFEFKDSPSTNTTQRNVVICWSKTISTQLAVTLDDQKRNELQIWDLRNQKGPVAVFDRGHTKGINTMQWCETDPELILTGGRDNKIVCWNYTQEESPISTYNLNSSITDIKWSKKLRSIYSVSLQDRIQIYSLDNANLFSYVPKWYRVPIGTAFLGNDLVLKYSQSEGQKLAQTKLSVLAPSSQTSTLHNLLKDLQAALDQNSLEQKSKESQFWNLINIKNSNSGDDAIYDYLGFNKQKIIKQVEKYTGKKRQSVSVKAKTQTQPKAKSKAYTPVIGQQAASFFASIGQTQMKSSGIHPEEDEQNQSVKYDMVPRNFNWNIGKQRLIKHNILIGNYEGAIDAAIKCGRTAQALIIAYSVDQNTFNSALKTFFTETTDNFITDILKNITYRDNQELVRKFDLDNWKQCIALIYSISTSDKRRQLLNLLASRIREESLKKTAKNQDQIVAQDNPAIQCYILSENFNQIANLYFDNLRNFQNGTNERKQAVVEYAKRLILIFNSLTVQVQPCKNFQKIIRESAFIATQQNFKMVSYLIFSNYIFETSMKEVDMIIHATKNLEEYRNSIVFKQINIPVMQFKDHSKEQAQGQNPKNKKAALQQQTNVSHGPPKIGQQNQPPTNPNNLNVPTKDKNSSRPPIFNKKQEQKQVVKNTSMPPPPPTHHRSKPQVYEEQQEQAPQPPVNVKSNLNKKVPPPPGLKGPVSKQIIQNQPASIPPPVTHQQSYQPQNYHQQSSSFGFEGIQKKSSPPPPSLKNRNVPRPPPPASLSSSTNLTSQSANYAQQSSVPLNNTSHIPQYSQQSKRNVPRPPQSKIPPPSNKMVKQLHYQQQQEEDEDQQQQYSQQQQSRQGPGSNQRFNQQYNQQPSLQQKKVKPPPPPPSTTNIPKPPGIKNNNYHNQKQQQNSSFSNVVKQQTNQNYNYNSTKPNELQPSSKKNLPPPPGRKQQQYTEDYEDNSSNVNRSRTQMVKPPPPNKLSGKTPPPPPHKNQPPVQQQVQHQVQNQAQHQAQYQAPQKNYPQHQYQQQQAVYEQEKNQQYETPIIKRPPPPISGKKGPPPPPRR